MKTKSTCYCHVMPVSPGLAMFDRWDRLWQSDTRLDARDREDLTRLSFLQRWSLLQANAHRQPMRVMMDSLKLGMANLRLIAHAGTAHTWTGCDAGI